MNYRRVFLGIVVCIQLAGCTYTQYDFEEEQTAHEVLKGIELPATFSGQIPCPDCLRTDITLNLRPDKIYQLRKTHQTEHGPRQVESQMRNWRYSQEGNLIVLGKQKGMLKTYIVVDNNTLRFLELESERGDPMGVTYELRRMPEGDRFADTVKMRGMFSLRNNQAVIEECSSGNSFPVARVGDYPKAVKEYMSMPNSFGEPLLIAMNGNLTAGKSDAGEAQEAITIQKVKKYYPNQDCDGKPIRASLTGTLWRLSEIDNRELSSFTMRKTPYLTLEGDNAVRGFGGCNSLTGTYLARGDLLLFNRKVMTRLACFEGLELENLLIEVLDKSESFEITDDMLKVRDLDDKVRAVFRAGS